MVIPEERNDTSADDAPFAWEYLCVRTWYHHVLFSYWEFGGTLMTVNLGTIATSIDSMKFSIS